MSYQYWYNYTSRTKKKRKDFFCLASWKSMCNYSKQIHLLYIHIYVIILLLRVGELNLARRLEDPPATI